MKTSHSIFCICIVIVWISGQAEAFSSLINKNLFKGNLGDAADDLDNPDVEQMSRGALHRAGMDIWTGKTFKIEHQVNKEWFQCKEKFQLTWKGEEQGRIFKAKCKGKSIVRNAYHIDNLMLIGDADDDLCIFSTKENEYYFKELNGKEKGKWKKVTLLNAGLKEEDAPPAEINTLSNKIKNFNDEIANHVKVVQEIANEREKEAEQNTKLNKELFSAKYAELNKFKESEYQITAHLLTETPKEKELDEKIQIAKRRNQQDVVFQLDSEKQTEIEEKEKRIKQEIEPLRAQYDKQEGELNQKIKNEQDRYGGLLKSMKQKHEEEQKRFDDKIKQLLSNGGG